MDFLHLVLIKYVNIEIFELLGKILDHEIENRYWSKFSFAM